MDPDSSESLSQQQPPNTERTRLLQSRTANSSTTLSPSSSRTRLPVSYNAIASINDDSVHDSGDARGRDARGRDAAILSRYKYYSRLVKHGNAELSMPDHVVPAIFWSHLPVEPTGKQNSLVTIFSIWNTMMGTSLLSMPWAIGQAGFGLGIGLMVFMAAITLYTSYRVMKSVETLEHQGGEVLEFSNVCRQFLGRWGEFTAVLVSVICLLGGAIVYWVLMSNFLYNTVLFIHNEIAGDSNVFPILNNTKLYNDEYIKCESVNPPSTSPNTTLLHVLHNVINNNKTTSIPSAPIDDFNQYWNLTHTVPFFLVILLLPLINFKSPTFFTKFNALGTISVLFLVGFITFKSIRWGFHLDFNIITGHYASIRFPALTGIASLAYFIHNCVLSIVRNQAKPENNGRDLTIAFICVTITYCYVGGMFYAAWPMITKACIGQNLLDNLQTEDPLAFVARICLFLQMLTVYPLLTYIMRLQVMHYLFNTVWPSWKHVIVLNIAVVGSCLIFAVFMPKIGEIIRYTGAFCGLVYAFFLPCTCYLLHLRNNGKLTWPQLIFHGSLIVIGLANFISQFLLH